MIDLQLIIFHLGPFGVFLIFIKCRESSFSSFLLVEMTEKYSLKSQNFSENLNSMFRELYGEERYADVTLVSDDQRVFRAHRIILRANSPVLRNIIDSNQSGQHPLIYLRGIQHRELSSILQFIYLGEGTFYQDRMTEFLRAAKDLEVRDISGSGLVEVQSEPVEVLEPQETSDNEYGNINEMEESIELETSQENETEIEDGVYEDLEMEEMSEQSEMKTGSTFNTEEFSVTKLPCPVDIMNFFELHKWLVVELKKEFVEQGLRPVSCVPWGNQAYEPRSWPNNLWPWNTVGNPKQNKIPPPNGNRKVDVFKQYVRNRLKFKGIEPATHISESFSEEKGRARMKQRGYKVLKEEN